MQAWNVLKAEKHGRYLNSPSVFVNAGMIYGDSPQNALIRAMLICGSSMIQIVPMYEFHPEGSEDAY